jgi:hypothetical protein
LRLGDLLGVNSTYSEMLYQTLLLHFGEHAERLRDRTWLRCIETTNPQIDDIECIETEVREVIMYGLSELLGSERFGPISFRVPQRPDLGDDPQLLRIRMQRFFDKLIGYVRAIEVAGVDVGDTELNNLAQDRECTVVVCWRPNTCGPASCMAPYPMRVRFRSSASLNVPPGSVVDVVRFLLVFMFECVTVNPGAGAATARSSARDVQANASATRAVPLARLDVVDRDWRRRLPGSPFLAARSSRNGPVRLDQRSSKDRLPALRVEGDDATQLRCRRGARLLLSERTPPRCQPPTHLEP